MGRLDSLMRAKGLSVSDVARICGLSKATVSLAKNGKDARKETLVLEKLAENGYAESVKAFRVQRDVFVKTENTKAFDELCDEFIDPDGDLTSSIGVVIGRAGRGKTFAARRYAVMNSSAVYVLFIDGFSLVDVAREIAYELAGIRPRFFRDCVDVIDEATFKERRLVIIDEADKMPKKHIEMLRGLNERCMLPMVLVGEETLKKTLESERRLKSRVRRIVDFKPISLVDIAAYYSSAVGIELDGEVLKELHKRSGGDFRNVVKDAFAIVRILNANRLTGIDLDVVRSLR